jgi:hypothetical protein
VVIIFVCLHPFQRCTGCSTEAFVRRYLCLEVQKAAWLSEERKPSNRFTWRRGPITGRRWRCKKRWEVQKNRLEEGKSSGCHRCPVRCSRCPCFEPGNCDEDASSHSLSTHPLFPSVHAGVTVVERVAMKFSCSKSATCLGTRNE